MTRFKTILTIAILLMFLTQPAGAEEVSRYVWTAPVEGSPVHHYVVCVSMDNGECVQLMVEPTITTVELSFESNTVYTVKVAAVDADGRQGPWSLESDPYSYQLPGGCGKPERVNR